MKARLVQSFAQASQRVLSESVRADLSAELEAMRTRKADREHVRVPEAGEGAPVAIFVAHGMGQQVPFETIDGVVGAIRQAQLRHGHPAPAATVRQVQIGDERLARAELHVSVKGGPREIHLYEGYWAPLAQGHIRLRETFAFLLRSGIAGAKRAWAGGWWRLMFNQKHEFSLGHRSAYAFLGALLVLGAIGVINAVILTATASYAITGGRGPFSGPLLADLTVDLGLVLALVVILLGLGVGGVSSLRKISSSGEIRTPGTGVVAAGWLCVWSAVGTVVLGGGLVAYHLVRHLNPDAPRMWAGTWADAWVAGLATPSAPLWQIALAILIWGLVAYVSWRGRGFVLQYVGDVALYVSSHQVNRFFRIRDEIRKATTRVLRLVYSARAGDQERFLYSGVIVVGHSLGSVIAYDALNALIHFDAQGGGALRVLERTPLFLTSGSPLDKTAFIFRNQVRHEADVREALAQSMQPMVTDYATRPRLWINLWSPNDWVSGSLEYYNDASKPDDDPQHVRNVPDNEATTPLAAHNEYWDGSTFGDALLEAVARVHVPPSPGVRP